MEPEHTHHIRRRWLEALVGLGVISAAVVWLSGGCEKRIQPTDVDSVAGSSEEEHWVPVEVREGRFQEWTSGSITAERQTTVASRILARIEDIRVRAGSDVTEGDVLIRLDARDLQARLREGTEALRGAKAQLELAQKDRARMAQLLEAGVQTQARMDQADAALHVARADVDRLEQSLTDARTSLSYTELRAPVSGRVIDRLAEPGDTASPGQPLLRIYDPSALRVEVPVRESLAVGLTVGQELPVDVPSLNKTQQGVIEEIVPFAERGTRTLLVRVRIHREPLFMEGMYARVAIPGEFRRQLLVPAGAIERMGQLTFVKAREASGTAQKRLVTLGEGVEGGRVVILSGLREGEEVAIPPVPSE